MVSMSSRTVDAPDPLGSFPPGPSQPPPVTASLSMPPPNPSDPPKRPWHTLRSAAERAHAGSVPASGQRLKVSVLPRGTWFALGALIGGVAVVALWYGPGGVGVEDPSSRPPIGTAASSVGSDTPGIR